MTIAKAEFDLDSWEETTLDESPGARLFSIEITKSFRGEIEGTSVTRLFTATSDSNDTSAAYGGVELLDVTVLGKKGTFVLRHAALMSPERQGMEVLVVPNTGTGELAGITGSAQIEVGPGGEHRITLTLD